MSQIILILVGIAIVAMLLSRKGRSITFLHSQVYKDVVNPPGGWRVYEYCDFADEDAIFGKL